MKIEDILHIAEDKGLRLKVLERVRAIREDNPRIHLDKVYERAWEEVKKGV